MPIEVSDCSQTAHYNCTVVTGNTESTLQYSENLLVLEETLYSAE
jgi:hypothetical protein